MIALSGADIVLPDRVVRGGSIVIDNGRIAAIESRPIDASAGRTVVDLANHTIVPGFVDVHIHGIEGVDVLDGPAAVHHRMPVALSPKAETAWLESGTVQADAAALAFHAVRRLVNSAKAEGPALLEPA